MIMFAYVIVDIKSTRKQYCTYMHIVNAILINTF